MAKGDKADQLAQQSKDIMVEYFIHQQACMGKNGKLVENIVQGIARDCLAEAMMRVDTAGYKIVMHVHDEMIVDEDADTAQYALSDINRCMSLPIDWAPGLPLKGDGYVCDFYRKD